MGLPKEIERHRERLSKTKSPYAYFKAKLKFFIASYIFCLFCKSAFNHHAVIKKTFVEYHSKHTSSFAVSRHLYSPNPFTECMLRLEKNYSFLMYEWNNSDKPILYSIKIVNNIFYVLLNMFDINNKAMWRGGSYFCNGVPGGKVNQVFKAGAGNLIIECPHSLDAFKEILSNFSVIPENSTRNKNSAEAFTYDTKLFDECERKDIQHYSDRRDIKIGLTATIKGNRTKALEWAAYHHLIGFDHMWIYINEDWNNGDNLVHRDYITWIPFNFNILNANYTKTRVFTPHEVFRISSQNDALWRAKRMGLEWIAPIDFDEYIELVPPKSDNLLPFNKTLSDFGMGELHGQSVSVSDIDRLPKFLKTFQNTIGDSYTGIELNSIPFGRNQNDGKNAMKDLSIDYTWRPRGDPITFGWSRYKLILNVAKTTSVNIHYVGGSSTKKTWKSPADELRFNHYKNPHKGVFNSKHGVLSPEKNEIELDTSFKEKYRKIILDELY